MNTQTQAHAAWFCWWGDGAQKMFTFRRDGPHFWMKCNVSFGSRRSKLHWQQERFKQPGSLTASTRTVRTWTTLGAPTALTDSTSFMWGYSQWCLRHLSLQLVPVGVVREKAVSAEEALFLRRIVWASILILQVVQGFRGRPDLL